MTDEIFDVLSAGRRRRLLVDLLDHNPQDVSSLADGRRNDTEGAVRAGRPGQDEERIADHHVHLPKLVDCGYVRWDREEQTVTKGPRFDEIRPVLEFLEENRDELPCSWP